MQTLAAVERSRMRIHLPLALLIGEAIPTRISVGRTELIASPGEDSPGERRLRFFPTAMFGER
jgi:hypothetical protein